MSTNNITVVGRLASDPELRFAMNGTAVCTISVPDQKAKRLDDGSWENQSATTWFRVSVFKEAAEALAESACKGDEVVVTGRLITREWTDKNGEVRFSLEIDFARVGVVPRLRQSSRSKQSGGDPWASAPAGNEEAPF